MTNTFQGQYSINCALCQENATGFRLPALARLRGCFNCTLYAAAFDVSDWQKRVKKDML